MDDPVLVRDESHVRIITLNRPERLNAFTGDSYRLLSAVLDDADRDHDVRAVVLRGAGRAFSSGVDLKVMPADAEGRGDLGDAFGALLESLMAMGKPLIAAVHGAAVGFGATILLHCDLVLVAEDVRIRMPFTEIGIAPEAGSSYLLPLLIGPQRAAELLLTSRWVGGSEAVTIGLATSCHATGSVHDVAMSLARGIAELAPEAVGAAKRLIRSGRTEAVRLALLRESDEGLRLQETIGPFRGDRQS